MKLQLAKIYRGDTFAFDGGLLEQQINTNITSVNVSFMLRTEQIENPITITLE